MVGSGLNAVHSGSGVLSNSERSDSLSERQRLGRYVLGNVVNRSIDVRRGLQGCQRMSFYGAVKSHPPKTHKIESKEIARGLNEHLAVNSITTESLSA